MAGFLDDLSGLLGGGSSGAGGGNQRAAGGMTDFGSLGADPSSGIKNVLATLRSAGPGAASPQGQRPGMPGASPAGASAAPVGGAAAPANASMSPELSGFAAGIAAQRPGQSGGGAFLSGLAGALGGRQNAIIQNQKLALEQQQWQLEAKKQQLQIEQIQRQNQALSDYAKDNAGSSGNAYPPSYHGPGAPDAPPPQAAPPVPQGGGAIPGAPPPPVPPPSSGDPATPGVGPASVPVGGPVPASGPSPAPMPPQGAAMPQGAPAPAPAAVPQSGQPTSPPPMPANAVQVAPERSATQQFWQRVPPSENPFFLKERGNQMLQKINPYLPPDTQNALRQQAMTTLKSADDILNRKYVLMNDGRPAFIPGIIENETQEAAAKAAAEASAKAGVEDQHTLLTSQPQPGGPVVRATKAQVLAAANAPQGQSGTQGQPGAPQAGGAQDNLAIEKQPEVYADRAKTLWSNQQKMQDQFDARQTATVRLQQLSDILGKYETGSYNDNKANMIASLKAIPGIGNWVSSDALENAKNQQEFVKLAMQNTFADLKAVGGRPMVAEIEGLQKANANPNLQPGANQAIIGSAIGAAKREDERFAAYSKWHSENPLAYDDSAFHLKWNNDHPAIDYAKQGIKDLPVKGVEIPETSKRVDGQMYVTPKGPARWVAGKGWQLQGAQ